MEKERCGGPENAPDGQDGRTTAVVTSDGCEYVHVDMGTGQVTYTPVEDGACSLKKEAEEKK